MRIFIRFFPFDLNQEIRFGIAAEQVVKCPLAAIPNTVCSIVRDYSLSGAPEIYLVGVKKFCKKYEKDIRQALTTEFEYSNVNINIISEKGYKV